MALLNNPTQGRIECPDFLTFWVSTKKVFSTENVVIALLFV